MGNSISLDQQIFTVPFLRLPFSGLLNFKTFYRNRQFFNWWRGYQEPDFDENEDYMDDYIDKVIRIDNRREPESPFS